MTGEPDCIGGIALDFAGIPQRYNENFPYEHAQVGQWACPARWYRVFLISFVFFQYQLNNIKTFVLHEWLYLFLHFVFHGFKSLFIVKMLKKQTRLITTWLKQSFSSDIINFLIEVRQKIPYERWIKIISPMWASRASSPYMNAPYF